MFLVFPAARGNGHVVGYRRHGKSPSVFRATELARQRAREVGEPVEWVRCPRKWCNGDIEAPATARTSRRQSITARQTVSVADGGDEASA
jgi:hypothetical protein